MRINITFCCVPAQLQELFIWNLLRIQQQKFSYRPFEELLPEEAFATVFIQIMLKTSNQAEIELRNRWKIISDLEVKNYFSTNTIKLNFIFEMSPWWEGFYERIVRSAKNVLRKVACKTTLSFTQLHTVLTEIEASINSRPIAHVISIENEPPASTAAHFLSDKN